MILWNIFWTTQKHTFYLEKSQLRTDPSDKRPQNKFCHQFSVFLDHCGYVLHYNIITVVFDKLFVNLKCNVIFLYN